MILAVCVDDKFGMMFNKRRQSRDRMQQEDLLRWCAGRKIWVHPYSASLFEGAELCVDDAFIQKAEAGDVCFVENVSLNGLADEVEALVLYRWNRRYPADLRFDLDMTAYELEETIEFAGASHERITREIYKRKG
jgi:hypothetical protein